jgi:glycosyltransferase involved in cell wall biosynthesis
MRILLLNQSDRVGGAAVACRRLFAALQKKGILVDMLCGEKNIPSGNGLHHYPISANRYKFLWAWERIKFIPFERNKSVRFLISTATDGLKIAKTDLAQQADLVHFHWINKGFLSLDEIAILGNKKRPIVWTLHDMWAFTGGCHYANDCRNFHQNCGNCSQFLKKPAQNDLTNQIWQRKKAIYQNLNIHIVCCSNWLADEARKSSLLENRPIHVIPNPIDTEAFSPSDTNETTKGKKTVLFQAMNLGDERKGFAYLIQALYKLNELEPTWQDEIELLLFGKVADLPELPYPIRSLGSLTDTQSIVNAYRQSHVFVIPSLEENLPNTVMESLACGVPVVGFKTGGIPEMIVHEQTGYIAHRCDTNDLAAGLRFVLADEMQQIRLGRAAREFAVANYAESVVAAQYTELYRNLIPI